MSALTWSRSAVNPASFAPVGPIATSGLTMNAAKLLARTTAGLGAVEEFDFLAGTFTPTFTFATPGDLSVSYTTQSGIFFKLGPLVFVRLTVAFTPTHTTASGSARVAALPYTVLNGFPSYGILDVAVVAGIVWPTGTTQAFARFNSNATNIDLICQGNSATRSGMGLGSFPTGVARQLDISGFYRTAA